MVMEMNERVKLVPGGQHPITLEKNPKHVIVSFDGVVVADTRNAVALKEASYPAVQYIPRADVDMRLLKRSLHTTYCPYKGDASYFHLSVGDAVSENAIWTYEMPYEAVAPIKEYVAFYPDRVDLVERGD